MVVRVFLSAAAGLAAVLALQHALAFPVEGVNTTLPVGTELNDDALDGSRIRKSCMHPGASSIGGAEISAVRAGGPGDLLGDGADAAETFGGVRGQQLRRGLG